MQKILIWGEDRDKIWPTLNSCRDIFPMSEVTVGCGDRFQQNSRMIETLCGFAKVGFEPDYRGKLDFIGKHKDDPIMFCHEGVLVNKTIKPYTEELTDGDMVFANIKIDDGRYLNLCDERRGAFESPTEDMITSPGGQNLTFFLSGGGLTYPTFFTGNFGEGLILPKMNNSEIKSCYVRFGGNLDLQISQEGCYVLVMGLKSTGLWDNETEMIVKEIIDEAIYDLVVSKVEHDLKRA